MASSSSSSRREPAFAHGDLAGLRCLGSECGSNWPETGQRTGDAVASLSWPRESPGRRSSRPPVCSQGREWTWQSAHMYVFGQRRLFDRSGCWRGVTWSSTLGWVIVREPSAA